MTEQARMTIGKLAKQTGVSTDAIRFYETEKILMPAGKSDAGYRLYDTSAVQRLAFVKQAQHCGMTLSEIKQLLELKADGRSCCSDVRSLAVRKKLQLEHKIGTMKAMSRTLGELIKICTAEDQPLDACPILAALDSPVRASR